MKYPDYYRDILSRHEVEVSGYDVEKIIRKERVRKKACEIQERIREIIAYRRKKQAVKKLATVLRQIEHQIQLQEDIKNQKKEKNQENKNRVQAIALTKNAKQGVRNTAINLFSSGDMSTISTDILIFTLLKFILNPNPKSKADRNMRKILMPLYLNELEKRKIDTDKVSLQLYMSTLPDERRKSLLKIG